LLRSAPAAARTPAPPTVACTLEFQFLQTAITPVHARPRVKPLPALGGVAIPNRPSNLTSNPARGQPDHS
jgi:hypothetical protein